MANGILNKLLQEYDIKRRTALSECEERKRSLFDSCPKLKEVEDEINLVSMNTVKSILLSTPIDKEKHLTSLNDRLNELKKVKHEILSSLELDDNYLEPKFSCSFCNDTGYITNSSPTVMCNCLKQAIFDVSYNMANLNNLDTENFSTFDFSYYSEDIDFEKYKVNISPRDNIKNILKITKSFISNFNDNTQKNLLFTGNTGLGKTFLSNCIATEILKQNKTVLYQTSPIMLDTIIDYRFNKNDGMIYHSLLTTDLLIIDDLGTETINSMKFTELFNIINSRLLTKQTKTIISTNLNVNELFSRYDERLVSRFASFYEICRFFGDDIRLKQHR